MGVAEFAALGEGRFQVTGELDFESVPGIWERSAADLDASPEPRIDLGGVTRVDSAALALVIEWLRWGAERGRRLHVVNVPEKLMALARISEVAHLLDGEASEQRP